MNYSDANLYLKDLKEQLDHDGHFKISYTNVWFAIANKVEQLAFNEQAESKAEANQSKAED